MSCNHEIVFALICRTGRAISGSQLVQNSTKKQSSNFGLIEEILLVSFLAVNFWVSVQSKECTSIGAFWALL